MNDLEKYIFMMGIWLTRSVFGITRIDGSREAMDRRLALKAGLARYYEVKVRERRKGKQ